MTDRISSGLGGKLRDARERRGVSLRQIANATKISVAVLEGLERNDISRLPGGIFGRAFVRSYASEVGLDPEETIKEFIAQFPQESVTVGHPTVVQVVDHDTMNNDRRMSRAVVWLLAICLPIGGALLYFGAAGWRAIVGRLSPSDNVSDSATSGTTVPGVVANTPTGGDATDEPAGVADPPAEPPLPDRLTVSLRATAPCWVSTVVDGTRTIDRQWAAGEKQTIEVRRELVLTASDAASLAVTLNGADARPLGKAGEAVTTRLNLTNFKDYLTKR